MINFSELVWRHHGPRLEKVRTLSESEPEAFAVSSAPPQIPVQAVQLAPDSAVALLNNPDTSAADRLRFLRMRLRELREIAKLQSIVITSPLPGDGKSTVAATLAASLASGGQQKVLLMEADLHHPSLESSLGLPQEVGMAECLEQDLDPLEHIRKLDPLGFYFLACGQPQSNPTDLLQSDALENLIKKVCLEFDWILIDSPPLLPLTDAVLLSRRVDATLLVARADRTNRQAIEEALKLVDRKSVVGIILNGAKNLTQMYSQYYGNRKGKYIPKS